MTPATRPEPPHVAPSSTHTSNGTEPPAGQGRIALLAGSTGLVGRTLCSQLAHDNQFEKVIVLSRRPLSLQQPRLQVAEIDFSRLDDWTPDFEIDTVFCALGTTMAKAGSEAAFRAIDYDMVLTVARLAQRAHCKHFILVSSAGATPQTNNFYLRTKGEAEEALRDMGLPHLVVMRPSVLDGEREEERKAEQLALRAGRALRPLLVGPLERFRPTPVELLATAMREVAQPGREGFEVIDAVTIGRWQARIRLSP